MAETLSTLSIISFAVAGVALAVAIFLWVFLKIPQVIGNLSGRTARKSIARVRASNEKSGNKSYRSSTTNVARGKLTSTMPPSDNGEPAEKMSDGEAGMPETGLLADNKANPDDSASTELLLDNEATGLLLDEDATAPLDGTITKSDKRRSGGKKLKILDEVVLTHTDEVIE